MANYVLKEIGACPNCGRRFAKNRHNQKYCTPECSKAFHYKQSAAKRDYYIERRKEKKAEAENRKKERAINWNEISRICKENNCTYGQAVARGLI